VVQWFIARSKGLLLALAASVVVFAVALTLGGTALQRSVIITIDLITGGSPDGKPELRSETFVLGAWFVRLAGWLLVPAIVAVLLDEAQTSRDVEELLKLKLEQLVAQQRPDIKAAERRDAACYLLELAKEQIRKIDQPEPRRQPR
jgi:hypothetical protein